MKFNESWLREWVNPALTRDELATALTMAGLEVDELAPLGQDYIFDIAITPNRGDCLSVRGIAREVAALTHSPMLRNAGIPHINISSSASLEVKLEAKKSCPAYLGRVIENVKVDAVTPSWLKERLANSGVSCISPVVDVTNYVMLELGQPMHAFDLATIKEKIIVRNSKKGERIALLDGTEKELDDETLVIADAKNPLAIAGVMGGMESSVTLLTKHIFLESAFFQPEVVARQRQAYNVSSDSAYRFERGVDPAIAREAIERATQLILEIAGGQAGPITEVKYEDAIPASCSITLTQEKLKKVLGMAIPDNEVEKIFNSLNFPFTRENQQWQVKPPSYRFDMSLPEDLIEEIARIHGYDNIPTHSLFACLQVAHSKEEANDPAALKQLLADAGYHEIISYSFIDKKLQTLLDANEIPTELVNPITADMTVMRTNLWPGLVNALLYNINRQQERIRLFETGTCFTQRNGSLSQEVRLGGLATGLAFPEQWGMPGRQVDFFDVKGDIEKLLHFLKVDSVSYKPEARPGLHPGQTAGIYQGSKKIGILAALHPSVLQALDLSDSVFVYEIDLASLEMGAAPHFAEISKFPEIRRDVAILVNEAIPAREIQDTIQVIASDLLKDVFVFDVYQGKGISPGLKSIALALILQHPARTLVDDEVNALMERVTEALKGQLGAELRR